MISNTNILFLSLCILVLIASIICPLIYRKHQQKEKLTGFSWGILFYIVIHGFIIGFQNWAQGIDAKQYDALNQFFNGELNTVFVALSTVLSVLVLFAFAKKSAANSKTFSTTVAYTFYGLTVFQSIRKLIPLLFFSILCNMNGAESLVDTTTSLSAITQIIETINSYDILFYLNIILSSIFDFFIIFSATTLFDTYLQKYNVTIATLACTLLVFLIYGLLIGLSFIEWQSIIYILIIKTLVFGSVAGLIQKLNSRYE